MNALHFFKTHAAMLKNAPVSLVLLDLKIPHLSGIDLLREIKDSPLTRHLPVVVITGAASPAQVEEVYALGANSVIEKASTREKAVQSLRSTLDFWLNNNVGSQAHGTP